MKLIAEFPDYLDIQEMLIQDDIPCFCKVGNKAELVLDHGRRNLHGELLGWNEKNVCSLCPAGAGGEYVYYNHAMVTINKTRKNEYDIINLKIFDGSVGWCDIIVNGEYVTISEFED